MRTAGLSTLAMALVLTGCSGGGNPPPPPTPPHVFLVAPQSNVVGTSFDLKVNVAGCDDVQALEIHQNKQFVKTVNYNGANTVVTVTNGDLGMFYKYTGIAADLTLTAKVLCRDQRVGESSAVGLKFFPVKSVYAKSDGSIVLPDSFIAEGSGSNTTFIGCADTGMGLGLVRADTQGNVVAANTMLPFPCDYNASITDKINGSIRWLIQPTQGAFAFDSNLNVTGGVSGQNFAQWGVGPDGDLVVWDNMIDIDAPMFKVAYNAGIVAPASIGNPNIVWAAGAMTLGILNGQPVADGNTGNLLVPSWHGTVGGLNGAIEVHSINYATGGQPIATRILLMQDYGLYNTPIIPNVAFDPTAATVYVPYSASGTSGAGKSGVYACPTSGSGNGCPYRWKSGLVDGMIRYVIPFAKGTRVAAISDTSVWFLNDLDGSILNPGGLPTTSSGSLVISAIQVGKMSDFYMLNASPGSSFASEIVAFDQAENGELWRYSIDGTPQEAQTALTIAIDDLGSSWLRIGLTQVVPLSLVDYRNVRGPWMPAMP
jgi:hypothetical protein